MSQSTLISSLVVGLLLVACDRPPEQAAPAAPATAPALEDGAPPVQEASPAPAAAAPAPAAAPAAAPPAPRAAAVAKPSPSPAGGAAALDMKELERNPGATPPPPAVTVPPGPAHASLAGKPGPSPAFGKATAPVRIVLFSDFQCPVCKRVVEPAKALAREYPEQVQITWKHNALQMHPNAEGAAVASIAAFRQGKFWEFHDELFKNQRALTPSDLRSTAQRLGLDMARYDRDVVDPAVKAQVEYERGIAEQLEARGTPGLFINGKKQVGWGSYGGFKAMFLRALTEAQTLSAGGTAADRVAEQATRAAGDDGKKLAELLWGPAAK